MGIKFECVHCGHTLHVKDYLAGKRAICPHCQGKIEIPATSTVSSLGSQGPTISVEVPFVEESPREVESSLGSQSSAGSPPASGWPARAPVTGAGSSDRIGPGGNHAANDPISEAPQLNWYVLPPGSVTKYGPAHGEMMRSWLSEGRISADSFVWREGWPHWRPAASVFPQIVAAAAGVAAKPTAVSVPATNIGMPAAEPVAVTNVQARPAVPAGDPGSVVLSLEDTLAPGPADRTSTASFAIRRKLDPQRTILVSLSVAFVIVVVIFVVVLINQ